MSTFNPSHNQMLLEAIEHHKSGRLAQAEFLYKQLVTANPQAGEMHANLALAQYQQGKFNDAFRAMEKALPLLPARIDLHDLLGSWYFQHGDPHRAIVWHRKAIAIDPNSAPSHANLGLALSKKQGGADEAIAKCRRAVELAPDAADAHRILSIVLEEAKRFREAADACAMVAKLDPTNPEGYGRGSQCLEALGLLDEATTALEDGIRNCPGVARLHSNLSCLLRKKLRFTEALAEADRAIAIAPAFGEAHGHRSIAMFSLGDYRQGFAEYEWRWRCDDFTTRPRDFNRPMWDGSDPKGRTIFVHTEQGLGDSLQFARFLPMLADAGATVIFECHHSLRKLMSRVRGVSRIVVSGTALPNSDLHAPIMSLPRAFQTTLETLPRDVPYLNVDPERAKVWSERIKSAAPDKFRVGLIWAGNAKPDANRTIPADVLKQLAGVDRVQFFSLQKKDAETFYPAPAELNALDVSDDLTDFDETAAAMKSLDLVITLDSGPAHLAGGLGVKTFIMVPWSPDWRWLAQDDNGISAWYPTMKIFRQLRDREWQDVIVRVRDELEKLAR